ncbi:hypothetical protein CSOJ01_01771 [Colletotrichum sojae]|uniref:Uncharacterized protein n=1 Tax=Colletotrichum sojae TaxID=2175907 RepID=A0A8H6JTT3_9PEZI|nr:hypothetical protein CSOJ01_01771 [Colletotrichum sojae]
MGNLEDVADIIPSSGIPERDPTWKDQRVLAVILHVPVPVPAFAACFPSWRLYRAGRIPIRKAAPHEKNLERSGVSWPEFLVGIDEPEPSDGLPTLAMIPGADTHAQLVVGYSRLPAFAKKCLINTGDPVHLHTSGVQVSAGPQSDFARYWPPGFALTGVEGGETEPSAGVGC